MIIPIGYGDCRIQIRVQEAGSYIDKQHYFYHVEGSSFEGSMVANEYETINHKKVQKVQGYHLNFSLALIDKNIGSGIQSELVDFLNNFYNNHFDNNTFLLDLYNGGEGATPYELGRIWVVSGLPKLTNVGKNNIFGQQMTLQCQSRDMLTKEQMREFWSAYRDTSDGSWSNTITRQTGYVEPKTGVRE